MKNKRKIKRQEKELQEYIQAYYHTSKMVKVNDPDMWCPAFPNSEVLMHIGLSYSEKSNFNNVFLVVAGMDDTALELRYKSNSFKELQEVWEEYKCIYDNIPHITNFKWYVDRGFKNG